jgi:DNA-binding MarR family transcriptional regulator
MAGYVATRTGEALPGNGSIGLDTALSQLQALLDTLQSLSEAKATDPALSPEDVIRARRRRNKLFDAGLFADPAWDMLLELYACHRQGKRISVSSVVLASGVPYTTALRCLDALLARGLISRETDSNDGRRVLILLSPSAREAMSAFFKTLPLGLEGL